MRIKFLLIGIAAVLTLSLGAGCGTRVGPGHVGIKIDLAGSQRGAEDLPIKTGWVFYNPLSSNVVEYPTFVQTAKWTKDVSEGSDKNEELSFNTKEGLTVYGDLSISYQLIADQIPQFYIKFRNDDISNFTHGYLRNQARDAINKAASQYTVEEIMGPKKSEFEERAKQQLQSATSDLGVQIIQFGFIGSPRPPDSVVGTINAKVQAQQIALQKQTELQQTQAEAQKQIAYAEGQAKSAIIAAEGQATANRALTSGITQQLVEWRRLQNQEKWIEKWNGATPTVTTGAGGALLYNLNQQ